MLTLVGDPATFLVGSSIGLTFMEYLRTVSLGGLLAVLVVIPLLPRLMPEVWTRHSGVPQSAAPVAITRPGFVAFALIVLAVMVLLFLVGENLPVRIMPPEVAIIGATIALLAVYGAKVEPVDSVLKDVDWSAPPPTWSRWASAPRKVSV